MTLILFYFLTQCGTFTTLFYLLIYAAVKTDLIAGAVCANFITQNLCGHMSDPSDFQAQGGIPQKSRKVKKSRDKCIFPLVM